MKLKVKQIAAGILLLICVFACYMPCDIIPEGERIIEMDEVIPQKKVLLMDFTDQDCINCLQAASEVEKIRGSYSENIIPVSVHASLRRFPLRTTEGNEYQKHYLGDEPVPHPNGVIDGVSKTTNFSLWGGLILERFNKASSLEMEVFSTFSESDSLLHVSSHFKGLRDIDGAKLLLWIIEDKVINFQLVSEGKYNYEFEHPHVFRSSINGTWGEDFSIANEQEKTLEHTYKLKSGWNVSNISVIAFIYSSTTDEVFDVIESPFKNKMIIRKTT
ncbi:MAG: Omp28 family outer membrane lipoprotein [Paludibacteraceae bacterium]